MGDFLYSYNAAGSCVGPNGFSNYTTSSILPETDSEYLRLVGALGLPIRQLLVAAQLAGLIMILG
jgi:hypothetical protein